MCRYIVYWSDGREIEYRADSEGWASERAWHDAEMEGYDHLRILKIERVSDWA